MASIRSHHTGDISKKKQGVREVRKKLMIPLITCDHLLQRDFPHMSLSLMHNPPGDGNCNFCALCFCLNHCGIHRSPGETKENFVGFFATASTEGEVPYELAKTAINKLDLRLENIIAECFDGAANMSGIRKGLATRTKECSSLGIYAHCYGHLLNLAL